jgi:hypothetical protein
MSWDISVQNLPESALTVADIPHDFRPNTLGLRSDIIAKIKEVVPEADFRDPAWGRIEGQDWSIEINIGDSEVCDSFMFHVRGSAEPVGTIAAILDHLKLRAIDCQSGEFFVAGPQSTESLQRWREYRDRVVDTTQNNP